MLEKNKRCMPIIGSQSIGDPPSETVNRLTMRFAKGDALFEKRGSWTDEQTDYWEAHGMREGKPLVKGSLLPIVWQRKETP